MGGRAYVRGLMVVGMRVHVESNIGCNLIKKRLQRIEMEITVDPTPPFIVLSLSNSTFSPPHSIFILLFLSLTIETTQQQQNNCKTTFQNDVFFAFSRANGTVL